MDRVLNHILDFLFGLAGGDQAMLTTLVDLVLAVVYFALLTHYPREWPFNFPRKLIGFLALALMCLLIAGLSQCAAIQGLLEGIWS